jgi:hypothetical protein
MNPIEQSQLYCAIISLARLVGGEILFQKNPPVEEQIKQQFEIIKDKLQAAGIIHINEFMLCESRRLALKPGQLYHFTVDNNCEECKKCAEDAKLP